MQQSIYILREPKKNGQHDFLRPCEILGLTPMLAGLPFDHDHIKALGKTNAMTRQTQDLLIGIAPRSLKAIFSSFTGFIGTAGYSDEHFLTYS
jgi:hypothetical protein